MKGKNILDVIGNTHHIKLNHLFDRKADVWIKLEMSNPGGSIKDRVALAMIEDAEERGLIHSHSFIVEPTSGNTGIGLAMVAAVKRIPVTLVMPESMSIERRQIMEAYGARVVLTAKEKGMIGAIEKAVQLVEENENAWMPSQFKNEANPRVHSEYTAQEIIVDFPEGIDYLITGVGTGGHITGCASVMKEYFPDLQVYAVEPEKSPVIGGGEAGHHAIQGIGAGFIPEILMIELLNGTISVSQEAAFQYAQRAAKEEGLLVGISSGAALAAIGEIWDEIPPKSRILTFAYDNGERYLSVGDLHPSKV